MKYIYIEEPPQSNIILIPHKYAIVPPSRPCKIQGQMHNFLQGVGIKQNI